MKPWFKQSGNTIYHRFPHSISAGDVYGFGGTLAVALYDAPPNSLVSLRVSGTFVMPCSSATEIPLGTLVYWDAVNEEVTVSSGTNNRRAGVLARKFTPGNGAEVLINHGFINPHDPVNHLTLTNLSTGDVYQIGVDGAEPESQITLTGPLA